MPRKGENIYKRKDGRWEGRYMISHVNGKAKYGFVYAHSYNEVKKKLITAKSLCINTTKKDTFKKIGFKEWVYDWLNSKKPFVKESTFIRYRNSVENHIIPKLGMYFISEIDSNLIKSFIQNGLTKGRLDGKGGLSPKTMTDLLIIIKEVFKYAQSSGITTICNFDQINIKKEKREIRVLSRSEETKLISVITNEMDRYKLGVYICLFTGIRIGELCALQWKNVSFAEKTLKVEQTMQRLQIKDNKGPKTEITITKPKSFASNRVIPLPDFLIDILRPFADKEDLFILSDNNDSFIEPRTMQNRFKAYLKEGNISEANFHSLRHTFATRCVEIGFDIKTLSELLGHSSVKITLDRYVHSSMEQKMLNMEKLYYIV